MEKIKKLIKILLYSINENKYKKIKINKLDYENDSFEKIIQPNAIVSETRTINLDKNINVYKYDGAINYKNNMYCISNGVENVLKINLQDEKIEYLEFKSKDTGNFKWTGGCEYKGKIYGFPRKSNELLCIDSNGDRISTIDLKLNYKNEHHYGGVSTTDGIIYQPPRNQNHILVINLNNFTTSEIKIAPKFIKYRYVSGVKHTNGLIYFLPERNEKVLVLNPKDCKFKFIGDRINSMVYDATIGEDGNIYGFSNCEKGVLKIDVNNQNAHMICQEIGVSGCCGSKLAINGKIYGIPGNGNYFWEFDVKKQKAKKIFEVENNKDVKCAGGIVAKDGSIYTVPAYGNKIYKIKFDNDKELSDQELNSIYFSDNY